MKVTNHSYLFRILILIKKSQLFVTILEGTCEEYGMTRETIAVMIGAII